MDLFTSACPRNCYSTCSMKLQVKDGRIRMIEPHKGNKATPEGVCLKGLSYIERVYSPKRILKPLKKIEGQQKFVQISWDEALDIITKKLTGLKETFGAQSILYYYGSGTKGLLNSAGIEFWRMFGGCTTIYGDLCWPAGLEATRLTLGENKHNAPWDLENAKLIIIWGKNIAETNIHQMLYIEKALEKGAKLIVIDPRRTQSAEHADLLIQPRPGTDGALALAVGNILIKNNYIDRSFIKKYVFGYDEFEAMIENFSPEKASEITEIPVNYIYQLGEDIGKIKPVSISAGFGMQRYTNSGQTMRALIALLAITGNIGKKGAGWFYANLQSSIFDKVKDPIAFFPPDIQEGVVRQSISVAKLGNDILSSDKPPIKMIWVERGNPVTQNPDTNTVLKAFRSLDFRVVVEQFLTDTAKEADIILPAKSMFEQSDIIGSYWHPYIQIRQKIIEPPGEIKPETEIYFLLAKNLGIPPDIINEKIPGPTDYEVEQYLSKMLKPFPDISLEKLKEGPVLSPSYEEIAFSNMKFNTPSGKIELITAEGKERWNIDPLPVYEEPEESTCRKSPESESYPLYFMTPNTKNRIHSQFNNLEMIRQFSKKPLMYIHPADASKRGIKNNDMVKIFNNRGNIKINAYLDLGIKPGCVCVTNGWWISEGGTVNFCSAGRETDIGYGAAFHDTLVEVERIK